MGVAVDLHNVADNENVERLAQARRALRAFAVLSACCCATQIILLFLPEGVIGRVIAITVGVAFWLPYTTWSMKDLVGRHNRTLRRHDELNAMSGVLISAEAIDEVQSAVVIAGVALLEGTKEFTFGVLDRDVEGKWTVVASTGCGSQLLCTLAVDDDDPEHIRACLLEMEQFRKQYVKVVPVVGEVLLGALVWISPVPFDVEFSASAATLAGQMSESIRRLEASDSIRRLLAHSIDALLILDVEGQVKYASPAVENLIGRTPEQVIGRSLSTLVHRQHVTQLVKHLHGDVVEATRFSLRWGHQTTGSWKETFTTISQLPLRGVTCWVFNVHDVSQQTELELELRHAQKLESVGRLAAGVAHEINTPIQFVGHNLRFIGSSFAEYAAVFASYRSAVTQWAPAEVQEHLCEEANGADIEYLEEEIPPAVSEAIEGTDRVAEIVRAMKIFGHPDGRSAQAVDINTTLASTLIIAQNEIKTVANVVTDFHEVPTVLGFAGDLNQVFLNLVINACHAMQDTLKGSTTLGTLTVRTEETNESVLISISDTGSGIPVHAREHVFEPFFTTKEVGQGTGQGLALAHAVVEERHGGRIWFETEEGKGTTFFVKLFTSSDHFKGGKREAIAIS